MKRMLFKFLIFSFLFGGCATVEKQIIPFKNNIAESVSGVVASNNDNNMISSFQEYMTDIKNITGRNVSNEQQELILDFAKNNNVEKLDYETIKEHRKDFDNKKANIRKQWAKNNNTTWPKYQKDVYYNGKVVRKKGQNYDAHHIIELSWNGPNVWWNMHPAAYPNEHQNGIHKGVAAKLFGEIPNYTD